MCSLKGTLLLSRMSISNNHDNISILFSPFNTDKTSLLKQTKGHEDEGDTASMKRVCERYREHTHTHNKLKHFL